MLISLCRAVLVDFFSLCLLSLYPVLQVLVSVYMDLSFCRFSSADEEGSAMEVQERLGLCLGVGLSICEVSL